MSAQEILACLRAYGASLGANFAQAATTPAQPEDQLKGPTQVLLESVGRAFDLTVVARTEALMPGGVRPDIGVSVGGLLAGHVELKAPGKGVRPRDFAAGHDREQFKRLADHPNLVYTDGIQWGLYRNGALVFPVVSAEGDIRTDGADAYELPSATALETLFRDFLGWTPLVPSSPKALAEVLAPLTRLLREHVTVAMATPGSALEELAREWRDYFFPDADDSQFADAYAQTLTYALLLARVEGEADLHSRAADRLDERHGLLAQVLRVLGDPAAREEVSVPVDLLERTIAAIDTEALSRRTSDRDLWLYFYEDFLAAYDPNLRRQRGVYFTPPAVVQAQTKLVAELLRERFQKELAFADEGVSVLDPAVGTGTYLLAALAEGIDATESSFGPGAVAGRVSSMAERLHGFELGIGPYAVAQLRIAQQILENGGRIPDGGVGVYLTDTLSSPYLAPRGLAHAPLFLRKLADENERARRIKAEVPILVCIGNPPYFRQVIEPGDEEIVERQGGWVRRGDEGEDGILQDFLRGTPGVHAKNLYNLYVYFWRWALWKVFENGHRRGVVSFITASSYLRGPGFAGMRRFMRETFDELWILDLGGEGRGARRSENVFAIQTPVAIAVGVRSESSPAGPARVRYARIDGTREEKFAALRTIQRFGDIAWQDCFDEWEAPLLPTSSGDFFDWPLLTDLFPWQHSGAQFKRTWPIGPERRVLEQRWFALMSCPEHERAEVFRETRDRKVARSYPPLQGEGETVPLAQLSPHEPPPPIVRYAYRSLDRQFCFADSRLGDFLRPALWRSLGARQLFLTTQLSELIGRGPAATATNLIPDMHYFAGRGAKDVIPLWRDALGTEPNLPADLLEVLQREIGLELRPEDLFAYGYAVLSAPRYTGDYAQELEIPGPRLPVSRDATLVREAIELGSRLIWLHTYGERFVPLDERAGRIPPGRALAAVAVPSDPDRYPTSHRYDPEREELHVGEGLFAPVSADVRAFSVSGLDVIGSWLDYRMQEGAGRRSSYLDTIRPSEWTVEFTEELLRLLWIVEHTVAMGPRLDELLTAIVSGRTVRAAELPQPTDAEREAPG
ncbi:MAG: type ISP restriction/modification enzyme [Gaiellaceae bacterium]